MFHWLQANYNMDADAASEAASAASKSLDEKASVHSDAPLIPQRKWIRTHAYIQGLTALLLVSGSGSMINRRVSDTSRQQHAQHGSLTLRDTRSGCM